MKFQSFLELVSKIRNLPLPGREVQLEMAPLERLKKLTIAEIDKLHPRQAAVMALFYPDINEETHIILILRKRYKGVHSNQVGFPGGKVEEADRDLEHTALRETEEEVGVSQKDVTVFKKLTNIYIPPSNFWVQSFIGYTTHYPDFVPQESEVEALIEVPLAQLLTKDLKTTTIITNSYMNQVEVPSYTLGGHIVWGATAMMLSEVRSIFINSLRK